MTQYCVMTRKKSSLRTFTVYNMKNVLLNMEEACDGGESDVEVDLVEKLGEVAQEVVADKRLFIEDQESVEFSNYNIVRPSSTESKEMEQ